MKRTKEVLVIIILLAVVGRVLWWALAPAVPLLIIAVGFVVVYSVIFKRRKW